MLYLFLLGMLDVCRLAGVVFIACGREGFHGRTQRLYLVSGDL